MFEAPENFNAMMGRFVAGAVVVFSTAAGILVPWLRKKRVDDANAALDISALGASKESVEGLRLELARLRADSTAALDSMQARLAALGAQLDQEIALRRAAEETSARLRLQLVAAGKTPEA